MYITTSQSGTKCVKTKIRHRDLNICLDNFLRKRQLTFNRFLSRKLFIKEYLTHIIGNVSVYTRMTVAQQKKDKSVYILETFCLTRKPSSCRDSDLPVP